jgi:hypothetical protein
MTEPTTAARRREKTNAEKALAALAVPTTVSGWKQFIIDREADAAAAKARLAAIDVEMRPAALAAAARREDQAAADLMAGLAAEKAGLFQRLDALTIAISEAQDRMRAAQAGDAAAQERARGRAAEAKAAALAEAADSIDRAMHELAGAIARFHESAADLRAIDAAGGRVCNRTGWLISAAAWASGTQRLGQDRIMPQHHRIPAGDATRALLADLLPRDQRRPAA